MLPRLHQRFERLEIMRQKIFIAVRESPPEYLNYNPPGKWNMLEILTHLLTAEHLSMNYIKKKSLGINEAGDSGVFESVKFLLLRISQRLPLKYKAPTYVIENTPNALSLDEIERQWDTLRNELRNFLESFDERNLQKKIYRHPVAGRLNIIQALKFFYEHIHHHKPQIEQLLNLAQREAVISKKAL